jgi:hypothetical protein
MKIWTVYYCAESVGKTKSHGANTEDDAINFMADIRRKGGHLRGLKYAGKDCAQRTLLMFNSKVEQKIISN